MTNTKKLSYLALLMAVQIVLSFFYIPVFENLRIYFTFIIMMIVAHLFNYSWVFIYAIVEDILAFFIYPTGPFFIGYTLTSLVSMTIYYIFLHKEITLKNVVFAKLFVNIIVNIGLNSLWSSILYSKAYLYYLSTGIIKNIALLPFEIILFMLVYRLIKPKIEEIKK